MRIWVFKFKLFWHVLFRNLVWGDSVLGLMWRIIMALSVLIGAMQLNQAIYIHISFPVLKWEVVNRTTTLGLLVLGCLVIIVIFLAIGSAWTRTRWIAPRLKLVHNPTCSACLVDFKDGRWFLRVGIKNLGSESIDGVVIYLTDIQPRLPRPELFDRRLALPFIGHANGHAISSVRLHPSGPDHHHAEFAASYANGQLQISPGPLVVPMQDYRGVLTVEGKSVPALIVQFSLSSDALTGCRPTLVLQPRNILPRWFWRWRRKKF